MAKNKKPRKPHRAKRITPYGGLYTVASRAVDAEPLTEEEQQKAASDYYAAISALTEGRATVLHFNSLVYAANTARLITRYVFTDADDSLVFAAMTAIGRMGERYGKTKKLGLDGAGLQALRDFAPLFEQLLEDCTAGEWQAARLEMARRLDRGMVFEARAAA